MNFVHTFPKTMTGGNFHDAALFSPQTDPVDGFLGLASVNPQDTDMVSP